MYLHLSIMSDQLIFKDLLERPTFANVKHTELIHQLYDYVESLKRELEGLKRKVNQLEKQEEQGDPVAKANMVIACNFVIHPI